MKTLQKEVKSFEQAHRRCREINQRFDIIINVLMLITSTVVTCLESLMTVADDDETIKVLKISLAGTCASLAGLNQIFNNSQKAEKHHTTSRAYFELYTKIGLSIELNEVDKFTKYIENFTEIRVDSIGLFSGVRRAYGIS